MAAPPHDATPSQLAQAYSFLTCQQLRTKLAKTDALFNSRTKKADLLALVVARPHLLPPLGPASANARLPTPPPPQAQPGPTADPAVQPTEHVSELLKEVSALRNDVQSLIADNAELRGEVELLRCTIEESNRLLSLDGAEHVDSAGPTLLSMILGKSNLQRH